MSSSSSSSCYPERKDEDGNAFYIGDIGGLMVPAFPTIPDCRQHARDVREMTMNPDDVIVVGFPKSGAHWVTSVVHMLMRGRTDEFFKSGLGSFLDRTPLSAGNIAAPGHSGSSPRLFYTHFKLPFLPKQVMGEKKVKLVYLQRNPKDTWVSLYNHVTGHLGQLAYEGAWQHFLRLMMHSQFWYGNWFDYVLDWERDIQRATDAGLSVFVNSYEDMKKDPVGQTEKLDRFLGYNRGRELCEQIAEACEFSNMKRVKDGEWKGDKFFKDTAVGFYRKGEVGDWKNWFTVAQNEQFDREYRDRMQGSELRYTFE